MRILEGEDQNIEFKESWNNTETLKWVCGFANAKGGKMYIGVSNDGEVVGLPNSRSLWRIFLMALSMHLACMMWRSIS